MSTFPDVRHDENYNVDFLNEADKTFVAGADWMLEQLKNLFENNLDVYAGRLEYDGDIDFEKVLNKGSGEICEMMSDWAEMERNMLVTGFIESMDEDEYEKRKKAAFDENTKADEKKEYYDTVHYQFTGEKISSEIKDA